MVVLDQKATSPFAPESDEETVKEATDEIKGATAEIKEASKAEALKTGKTEENKVKIDFENIQHRILALPVRS